MLTAGSIQLLAVALLAPRAPPAVSLDALVRHAAQHSPLLAAERAAIPEARSGARRAWSAWRPDLSADGRGQWSSVEAELDFADFVRGLAPALGVDPASVIGDLPPPTEIQPRWSAVGRLRVRQLVFDPRALHSVRIAAAGMDATEAAVEVAARDLWFTVARMTLGIESLDGLEAAAERALDVARRRVREAEVRIEAGIATPLDASRARTAEVEARSELEAVRAQRAQMLAELAALVGWAGELEAVVSTGLERLLVPGEGVDQRPEVDATRARVEVAKRRLASAEQQWLPSVSLEGAATYSTFEGFAGEKLVGSAFLGIQLPLYDGGRRYADADAARARLARARAQAEATRLQLRAEARSAEASRKEAQSQLALAEARLGTADDAVGQAERLYEEGLATSLDLREADARRFAAEQALTERRLALALAELELARARGARWAVDTPEVGS
jgi:outer membrane protein TolC